MSYTTVTASVTLNVGYAPAILTQPASQVVAVGQTATFTVAAAGAATLTYQWRVNGTPISGALGTSYTTLAAQAQDSGSIFDVVVTNAEGSLTSDAVTLTVNAPPSITSQPANEQVASKGSATPLGGISVSGGASVTIAKLLRTRMERGESRSREPRRAVWRNHFLQWRVWSCRPKLHLRRQPRRQFRHGRLRRANRPGQYL